MIVHIFLDKWKLTQIIFAAIPCFWAEIVSRGKPNPIQQANSYPTIFEGSKHVQQADKQLSRIWGLGNHSDWFINILCHWLLHQTSNNLQIKKWNGIWIKSKIKEISLILLRFYLYLYRYDWIFNEWKYNQAFCIYVNWTGFIEISFNWIPFDWKIDIYQFYVCFSLWFHG